jgi:hypothetical protein
MKKRYTKDLEPNWKPRRLSLNRETLRFLSDPALLGLARGAAGTLSQPEETTCIIDPASGGC